MHRPKGLLVANLVQAPEAALRQVQVVQAVQAVQAELAQVALEPEQRPERELQRLVE